MHRKGKTVLVICEAVTFAHLTRSYTIATYLADTYQVHFASSLLHHLEPLNTGISYHTIYSITNAEFTRSLTKGLPPHSYRTLQNYTKEEIDLIEKIKPDLILGDFRLSLSVSARLFSIPYINITNAHWSPYHTLKKLPAINHPFFNFFGEKLASKLFNLAMPGISKILTKPYNRIRKAYGFTPYENLNYAYTDGDYVLYCDLKPIVHTHNLPDTHFYIGPIDWKSEYKEPDWEQELNADPLVFISMGSSGNTKLLPEIVKELNKKAVNCLVAHAGKKIDLVANAKTYITDYIPLEWLKSRASLIISNGGCPLSYYAMRYGIPFIGISTNYDQQLFMEHATKLGSGESMKSGKFSRKEFSDYVTEMLENPRYKNNAAKVQHYFEQRNSKEEVLNIIGKLL